MDQNEIKDQCRKNLNRYTLRAFSLIPISPDPFILDIGCGSGVPTLALLESCSGRFVAVDCDPACLERLRSKVQRLQAAVRIEVIQASILALPQFPEKFDIILAEGSLHNVGFKTGMSIVNDLLKNNGHALIHEPLDRDKEKRMFFKKIGLEMIEAFVLNEDVWRNEYFACLENSIAHAGDGALLSEVTREIAEFRRNPKSCQSIYYILRKPESNVPKLPGK